MTQERMPFLELFSAFQPPEEARRQVSNWFVDSAVIDPHARRIQAQIKCPQEPKQDLLAYLEKNLKETYQVAAVTLMPVMEKQENPPAPASIPKEEPALLPEEKQQGPKNQPKAETAAASEGDIFHKTEALRREAMKQAAQERRTQQKGEVGERRIYGSRAIKKKPIPMESLSLDMGTVVVEGDVFFVEHRELTRRNAWIITFDITDYTSSIRVTRFMEGDTGLPIREQVKSGMHLRIQGRLNINRYDNDLVLEPDIIQTAHKAQKMDTAPRKRVELHLHTKMSTMDALTDTKKVVSRAIEWGHPAIAITDHGVVQSFPDAWNAAKGKIKVLLGTEAYYINDVDDKLAVRGPLDAPLAEPIVAFDIETTGLDRKRDVITEIGAVVLENGEVTERFQTFVDPKRPLSREIINLTGITDEMLVGAPSQEEAIRAFLDFVAGRPLAAHNAEFDIGFMKEGCHQYGIPFTPTYLDTLAMAQSLLPDLGRYKLDIVAKYLRLPDFNHHRASDDAATVAYMLVPFLQMLADQGATQIQQVNSTLVKKSSLGKAKRMPRHLIVLVKNKAGLRNLYKLVSLAHLDYFKRFPIMPKSVINQNREGLILGSACEAGELYQAVMRGKDWDELCRIASWYDFLEIQPLSNNGFMLRPDRNGRTIARDAEEIREWNRTIVRLGVGKAGLRHRRRPFHGPGGRGVPPCFIGYQRL